MGHSTATAVSLRQALRNSPWLVIAVGLHGIVLAVLSIVYVVQHREARVDEPPPIVFRPHVETFDGPLPVQQPFDRDALPPATGDVELTDSLDDYDPLPQDAPPPDLTAPVGEVGPADFLPGPVGGSSSVGVGVKAGIRGTGISTSLRQRPGTGNHVGDTGRGLIAPPLKTERAVREGLLWLARHQQPDGSWSAATLSAECTPGHPCAPASADYSRMYDPGLTGLALLAFLGRGLSTENNAFLVDEAFGHKYLSREIVRNGVRWLTQAQGPDGSFKDFPSLLYNEAIGTLALSEAYALSGNTKLREPAERAVRYLVGAQKANPFGSGRWGWRYTPGGDTVADTSVTGWVVMALKSAQLAGLSVPREALDGAVDYINWATGKDGLVGYLDPQGAGEAVSGHGDQFDYHVGTMSALGMLVRTFTKHDIQDPFLEQAAQQIVKDLPRVGEDRLSVDYYYWYYGSLALNQFDGPGSPRPDHGKYWDAWNNAMITAVLQLQDDTKEGGQCSRGGWLTPDRWCYAGGPVYATALNVLTLEVYYRYENAFGVTVKAETR
jgi:hypothetical protein